ICKCVARVARVGRCRYIEAHPPIATASLRAHTIFRKGVLEQIESSLNPGRRPAQSDKIGSTSSEKCYWRRAVPIGGGFVFLIFVILFMMYCNHIMPEWFSCAIWVIERIEERNVAGGFGCAKHQRMEFSLFTPAHIFQTLVCVG